MNEMNVPSQEPKGSVAEAFNVICKSGAFDPIGRPDNAITAAFRAVGCELEFTLPAGAIVKVGGKDCVLTEAVVVRSVEPITLVEGRLAQGERAWPPRFEARVVDAPARDFRTAAALDLDHLSAALKIPFSA